MQRLLKELILSRIDTREQKRFYNDKSPLIENASRRKNVRSNEACRKFKSHEKCTSIECILKATA